MNRWEYVRLEVDAYGVETMDDTVDQLGLDGWELVGVVAIEDRFVYLWFKREKR